LTLKSFPDSTGEMSNSVLKVIQNLSYIFSLLGIFMDQVSTRLGLLNPLIFEGNPNVAWMLELGIWLPIDLTILAVMILSCKLIVDQWNFVNRRVVYFCPLTYGVLRLITGISNFLLLVSLQQ